MEQQLLLVVNVLNVKTYKRDYSFEPTVITDCDTSMRIVQEEVFGPVVTVEGFADEEEAIRLANDSITV